MKSLYVAWQDPSSREWIPVAKLTQHMDEYILRYTKGAVRCAGFTGLGRMSDLKSIYKSKSLFPFFKNRIISKSRPEYNKYLDWLDLDPTSKDDPMDILAATGGIRLTDSFELIPQPIQNNEAICIKFFVRGIRHLKKSTIDSLSTLKKNDQLYLMKDFQNPKDPFAFALRTDDQPIMIGYVPKYFCQSISSLIDHHKNPEVRLLKINEDAPLDMRLLCSISCDLPSDFNFFESLDDFYFIN